MASTMISTLTPSHGTLVNTPTYTPTYTSRRNPRQIANFASTMYLYNTMNGPLPENPFGFDDGLLLKTEDELQEMDLSTLAIYTSTLSTSISLETSTLLKNQLFQGIYTWLIQQSQTTIDDLETEIATDTGLISIYQGYQDDFEYQSTTFISTLADYDAEILEQMDEIQYITSKLYSYSAEYESSFSTIYLEETEFISSATQYSTFYWTYLGYEEIYNDKVMELDEINRALSTAKDAGEISYSALVSTGQTWSNVGHRLSTLYMDRKNINSTLTQYRINEQKSLIQYTSSINGMSTLSSIYNASLTNELYAISLSTLTQKVTEYADALDVFNQADLLYTKSVPAQKGGSSDASAADKSVPSTSPPPPPAGNTALWAARSMAWSALQLAQAARDEAESKSKSLFGEAGIANVMAYEQILLGYDHSIISYLRAEQAFLGYKHSSLEAVARFSTIYDESSSDVDRYSKELTSWSTLYESSIIGASTLRGQSDEDLITIEQDYLGYLALSATISSLRDNYTKYATEYTSSIRMSTLFAEEYYTIMSNVSRYTTYYNSTNSNVIKLSNELNGANGLATVYYTTLFTNSSLTNYDKISEQDYITQSYDLRNQEEMAMYQYREAFCLSKRILYQSDYDSKILKAVTAAQATVAPGVIAPAIDLSIPEINASYSNLLSINTFLGLFSNIYTSFDTQAETIVNLSTSIGHEGAAWSTLDSYTKAQFYKTPVINDLQDLINASCTSLTSNQIVTSNLFVTYASEQPNIDRKKLGIIAGLSNFFPSSVIAQQDTEISSFIIMGEEDAATILATQSNYALPSGDMFILNPVTVPITETPVTKPSGAN